MRKLIKRLTKNILVILIFSIFCTSFVKAEIYDEIVVTGNERLSVETIIMFSGLNIKNDLNSYQLNKSLKDLYETNYFKDIEISTENNILQIKIIENPIIQSIKIEGVKNKSIIKKLLEVTKRSEKYPFLKNRVIEQKNLLLNLVRASGFYLSCVLEEVDVRLILQSNELPHH